jgi:TfoX/Sxy family transcriptional regulator of competence genes
LGGDEKRNRSLMMGKGLFNDERMNLLLTDTKTRNNKGIKGKKILFDSSGVGI